ncbi:hypothetical protein [Hoyosella altamirensis]|uniref:Major capsid protein n=1 Tax=Hoyosella altamirensis TaxID=616997 RepID=A0A839RTA7_9ACTN|nr:hypothetical protein [Hoyosella altamirensis]MBB3040142.1 hypothetical protein [Hoyosella altamirensis]
MGNIITSAFDGDAITVDDMLKDPTWLPERQIKRLEGEFLEELLFRNAGTNESGVIAFREAAAPYLEDDAETVAEFGEIPVSGISRGRVRKVIGEKKAIAVRVSWEMRRRNRIDMVQQQTTAMRNTMIRGGVRGALAAFDAATDVHTLPASAAWTAGGGDPIKDVFDAIELIEASSPEDDETKNFGYVPDTLVMHPRTYTILFRNEKVQSKYIGDAATANPLYTGIKPNTMFGLTVATSRFMNPAEVIVIESGVAGFRSDTDPLQMTPFYEDGGQSGSGGPNMAWRSDAFRTRILGVDNPKAVCRITGVTA